MAGRGPKPAETRVRRQEPVRGDWKATTGEGWQHGPTPKPPPGLMSAGRETWSTWFAAWFAAHWLPADLPVLRLVIQLWDAAYAGMASAAQRSELRQLMRSMGITPDGQQDRRWKRPVPEARPGARTPDWDPREDFGHLRVVGDE